MIKVLFFAQTRELIDLDSIEVESEFATADEIRASLAGKGGKWELALATDKLLVAINQTISPMTSAVKDGDEVAFFPPVTGG